MADKVALINLGCPKNLVDAEVMLGHLAARGYELTADMDAADVVVVNTCGFLQDAAQESVDTLLAAAERKKNGKLRAVVAAGCMTQRYGDDVAEAMPEVDGFLGVGQAHALPEVVQRVLNGERASILRGPSAGFEGYGLRLQSTPAPTAYLKISEGCDRKCAFCIIPQIRGGMVSRSIETLVREAEALVAQGTRELILIGQDPTRYGADLRPAAEKGSGFRVQGSGLVSGQWSVVSGQSGEPNPTHHSPNPQSLPELLARLNEIPDLRWIRLLYLFPDRHVKPVLEAVAALPKVCKYLDMPLQHASAEILRAMNRPGSGQDYLQLLENVRAACPDLSVRSTFIVGFPGETQAHFRELKEFTRRAQLDWVGVFRYSAEEGSPAVAMPGRVSRRAAQGRYDRLMALQQEISRQRQAQWVGRTVEVLVESVHGNRGAGRTGGQAPEIDGETRLDLRALPHTRPGDFILAEVTGSGPYDLEARALERLHRSPHRPPGLIELEVRN
jgi:ribosomal protein S12 methylthiotransferase